MRALERLEFLTGPGFPDSRVEDHGVHGDEGPLGMAFWYIQCCIDNMIINMVLSAWLLMLHDPLTSPSLPMMESSTMPLKASIRTRQAFARRSIHSTDDAPSDPPQSSMPSSSCRGA